MSPRTAGRVLGRVLAVAAIAFTVVTAARAESAPGATVDELVAIARRLSPDLAAASLEREAATLRAGAAGAFDDPMLRVTSDEDRDARGKRLGKVIMVVEQEIPLGGKRELRRARADAEVSVARAKEGDAAAELVKQVKVAFARLWLATNALRLARQQDATLARLSKVATDRYAQALGEQTDALRAETDRAEWRLTIARLESDGRIARARLNALLARPGDAPLAEPRALPPQPETLTLDDVLQRAHQANPALAERDAEANVASVDRSLASARWWPDVTVGGGAIQREHQANGWTAGIAVKLPLQTGVRRAQEGEASAKFLAARARREAEALRLQGEAGVTLATWRAAKDSAATLRTQALPAIEATRKAALGAYERGTAPLAPVLDAERRALATRIEMLRWQAEQAEAHATLEHISGDHA
jgi:outer membrane protein TolC